MVYEHKDEDLLVDDNISNETETMEDNVPEIVIDLDTAKIDKNDNSFSVNEVLFVKRKTLYWPAKVFKVNLRYNVVQVFHIKTI